MLRQLLDRVATVQQHSLFAVDKRDLRFARSGRGKPGVVSEVPVRCQFAHVDDIGPQRSRPDSQVDLLGRSIRMCEVKSGLLVRHEECYRNELRGRQTNAECQSCQFDWAHGGRVCRE